MNIKVKIRVTKTFNDTDTEIDKGIKAHHREKKMRKITRKKEQRETFRIYIRREAIAANAYPFTFIVVIYSRTRFIY